MKKALLLITFLLGAIIGQAQGQQQDYRIVYLKDNSVIKGYLLTTKKGPADGVQIKMLTGEELFLPNRYIRRIKSPKNGLKYIGEGRSIKPKGKYIALHFNSLTGIVANGSEESKVKRWGVGVHLVTGYKYAENFALGIGTGLDTYSDNFLIPFYADIRGVVHAHKNGPSPVDFTYNFALGYSIHSGIAYANDDFSRWRGGMMIYPAIGIRVARIKQTNLLLDVGYKFQYSEHEFQWWWGGSSINIDRIWYKSLVFRAGWEF